MVCLVFLMVVVSKHHWDFLSLPSFIGNFRASVLISVTLKPSCFLPFPAKTCDLNVMMVSEGCIFGHGVFYLFDAVSFLFR